jgi:hypothetical protein
MAKEIGAGLATAVGIGHELTTFPWKLDEMGMDLHNNGVGIGKARAGGATPDVRTPGLMMAPKGKK